MTTVRSGWTEARRYGADPRGRFGLHARVNGRTGRGPFRLRLVKDVRSGPLSRLSRIFVRTSMRYHSRTNHQQRLHRASFRTNGTKTFTTLLRREGCTRFWYSFFVGFVGQGALRISSGGLAGQMQGETKQRAHRGLVAPRYSFLKTHFDKPGRLCFQVAIA
jgi:hypothetical protein